MVDVIVVGAGITGCLIAHELSKKECNVIVVEKNADVANGASGANSAIVHSGHDPKEGTLKAKFNLEGNHMYPELCKELKVAYKNIGAFVVATSLEEEKTLEGLITNCKNRNIPYEILDGEKARSIEPNLSDEVSKALSLPSTGIITPWEVCIAAMEESINNGVELKLNETVKGIKKENDKFVVTTDKETYESKIVINCAGVYADEIAKMINADTYKITGRRGEYYVLDHKQQFVNKVIYPVPSDKGKGVLAIPTIHNNVLLGPNAEFVENKEDNETTSALIALKKDLSKTLKNIPYQHIIHTYAGLRPTGDTHDFVIKEDENVKNFIHVSCIESPGLTAAPAIAKYVCEELIHDEYALKSNYIKREKHIVMNDLSDEEKQKMIENNPDYGKIVCRCERVSLGEIKDVIHRACGATSINGVKKRCRPGMGTCQGGFCEPQILDILAKELNIGRNQICKNGPGSEIVLANAKEDL